MKKFLKVLLFSAFVGFASLAVTNTNVSAKLSQEELDDYKEQLKQEYSGYITASLNQRVLTVRVTAPFTIPEYDYYNEQKVDGSVFSDALYDVLSGYSGVEEINFIGKNISLEYSDTEDWLHRFIQDHKGYLTSIDLGGIVFHNNYNGSELFKNCSSLQSVNFPDSSSCNIENASYMFDGCTSLQRVNWGSLFDNSLRNAEGMLSNSGITSLDISSYTANGISGKQKSSRQDFLLNSNVTEVVIPNGVEYYLHVGGNTDKVWVDDDDKCYQDGKITDSSAGGAYRLKSRISTVNLVYIYGSSPAETVTEEYDVSTVLKISKQKEAKAGYKYIGCFSDSEGKYSVTSDITAYKKYRPTLYYIYSPITYSITYSGVQQGSMRYYKYTVEDEIPLEPAVKSGMDFKGWFTSSNFYPDTYLAKISKGTTGDLRLYPKWKNHTYKITYVLNGGKNHKLNKKSYTYSSSVSNVKLYKPKKKGCKFLGWYYDSTFESECKNILTSARQDVVLYAKWEDPDVNIKPGKVKKVKIKSKGRNIFISFKKDKKYKTAVYISGRKDLYFPDVFAVKQKGTKVTSAKLKRGKIYYVRLRHYKKSKTSKKTIYGKWTKVYKIRVKR